jgi:hypothetical protein
VQRRQDPGPRVPQLRRPVGLASHSCGGTPRRTGAAHRAVPRLECLFAARHAAGGQLGALEGHGAVPARRALAVGVPNRRIAVAAAVALHPCAAV